MNRAAAFPRSVSSASELLIKVDSADHPLGTISKGAAHAGKGQLHRAFSIFLLSDDGRVLLQKRAAEKPLWGRYWTNSCCSHPRSGETYDQATHRRLKQELGIDCALQYVYTFEYRAEFLDKGTEHELCSVYVGQCDRTTKLAPHPEEVMAWGWFEWAEIDRLVENDPDTLTPWFVLEWQELRKNRWPQIRDQLQLTA